MGEILFAAHYIMFGCIYLFCVLNAGKRIAPCFVCVSGKFIWEVKHLCKIEFLLCPVCKNKTRIKLRPDTVLENFPLLCPKCKQETLISVKGLHTTVITEPEAKA